MTTFSSWASRFFQVLIPLLCTGSELASADVFYSATGSGGIAGSLYLISPTTAATALIGPLRDASGNPYGFTGMAFQPGTQVLFASTANMSPTARGHLVKVDPTTALVTDIGSFGIPSTMADITFDPTTGVLYGAAAAGDHWLYTIDLTTGAATKIGTGSRRDFGGGGLAANSAGTIFATADGAISSYGAPTLQTVNETDGNETFVAFLNGGPTPRVINSLDFDSTGVLFGFQTSFGNSVPTHLVTINTSSGLLTDIGPSIDNTDALAILREGTRPPMTTAIALPPPNANGWNNTNVIVTLHAEQSPRGSDVNSIQFALSGAQNTGWQTTAGNTASVTISAEGITILSYFAADNVGTQESAKTLTVRIDKTPPVVSGMPAASCSIWPPNRKLVQVATVTTADFLSGLAPGSFNVTATSSEPSDPANPDVVITANRPSAYVVQLRAERLGEGTGRVYTVAATSADLAGNTATSSATCTVPHDQGK